MGANAQTAVPAFTAGQILTAAEMTQVNTGIPVFATTTTRDAAFGGTGEKVLAQGQYAYIEATSTLQVYTGSAWISAGGGLTLITAQTIGTTVASVTVSNAFSASYENYKIMISGGVGSASNTELNFKLGASATAYYNAFVYNTYNTTTSSIGNSNGTSWTYLGLADTNTLSLNIELVNPFLAKYTTFTSACTRTNLAGSNVGIHQANTSYTDFTITPASGTLTGGTVFVFGYQK